MTNDTRNSEILMGANDVCTLLGIKESTLRKYAILLKDAGYQFHVNDKGQRGYLNKDVIVLKRLIEIKGHRDMTLDKAVTAVISWAQQSDISLGVTLENDNNNRYDDDIKYLKETINKQNELLEKLVFKIEQQQKYIDERLEKRDQMLMESLKQSQETKMLLLAAKEEQKKKRSIFSFFNKN
ncbi:MAG: DUF3967 domain-containing protein [Bacillaceae bacterium]